MPRPSRKPRAGARRRGFGATLRLRLYDLRDWIWKGGVLAAVILAAVTVGYLVGRGGENPAPRQAQVAPAASATKPAQPARTSEPVRERPPEAAPPPTPAVPPKADPAPAPPEHHAAPAKPVGALAWQRNAVPVRDAQGRPLIAIVLDDVGVNRAQAKKAIQLHAPVTLSFMSYAEDLASLTAAARGAGHELMLHLPMEPLENRVPPGPEALLVGLGEGELNRRIAWALDRFDGYVGINNHMGSRFTADRRGMTTVLGQLRARGLLFLDSMTTPDSVGGPIAAQFGVPFAARDVFLDHLQDREHVRASLAKLEERARTKGYAIGIDHPHEETLDVLRPWLSSIEGRGFALAPVSAVVRRIRETPIKSAEAARTVIAR